MKAKLMKLMSLLFTLVLLSMTTSVFAAGKASTEARGKKVRTKTRKTVKTQGKKITTVSNNGQLAIANEILSSTTGLDPKVLQLGLNGYQWAKNLGEVHNSRYLTVVDFSMPSKDKRLWVINMDTHKVVLNTLVANGKNSGLLEGTRFSNAPRSLESSLGIYVTGGSYYGHHGLSMRIHGLQPGINSNVFSRAVIFHGASYVSPSFAKTYGRVGRSWGCFALGYNIIDKVVSMLKGGSVVYAYANNHSGDYKPYETT